MVEITLVATLLIAVHLGVPLIYCFYLKRKWLSKPWDIGTNESYRPDVTVIVPTYNEAGFMEKKLENIYEQQYPKELMEIMVVDSASTDGTVDIVEKWAMEHPSVNLKLHRASTRRGKMPAISEILNRISTAVIIIGDADSFWDADAVRNTIKYFADPTVAALTASLRYYDSNKGKNWSVENTYRRFYNIVRVAESKMHSTPIHSGVLQAIRSDFIDKMGLPLYPGSEDCAVASYIAFSGHRAIQVDDVWAYEAVRGNYVRTKVRRAQHNILSFLLVKRYAKEQKVYIESEFDIIWSIEWYLYMINPWLLVTGLALTLYSIAVWQNVTALLLSALGGFLLAVKKTFRGWVLQQLFLIIAAIRNLYTRAVTW